ncbi:tRNA (guanosine(37)-N1)-methyltransferase TrmD [candidate division WWE3 bacterium RIFCSPLOWO2_01_FULL_41_9]|uniref:tRNA (guanine-N(1)-)-methyltransferase n=4 Tax=Katanobacteria TaxID=422282 RepID=A0A1F4VGZ5_UNCKA|nr:MAG: tRNA (guanosine(37)-N1)-methyltransferase TrmD [candidate division WWE3 bacterium RIFCSPLOWO2_01_FULL_41_9]
MGLGSIWNSPNLKVKPKMLTFDVITLFPELFEEHLNHLPFKKAIQKGLLKVNLHNLRDYALDSYGTVDGKPYGGGTGMVLMVEPISKALGRIENKERTVLMSPRGKKFDQKKAGEYAGLQQITLICGRYEGVDARVEEHLVDESVSVGDYVLSGGELPALAIMESVTRLLPGVLEKEDAAAKESFENGFLEHPQYTRPEDFKGMKVPEVLLSGNHKEIEKWKKENSTKID